MKRTTPILASRYLRMPCVKKISPTATRMSTMLAGPAGAGAPRAVGRRGLSETSSHDPGSELSDRVDRRPGHHDQPTARLAGEAEHGEDEQGSGAGGPGSFSEKEPAAPGEREAEVGARSKR